MVLDHTLIDDPKTPAYKFAYRAFRGMLYGEPDDSPVKPTHDDREYKEKENDFLQVTKAGEGPVVKRKSPSRQRDETTPKRQRMIAASPSKSILRNPNLPTPRRTQSRDLTVTFKDLSRSLTPELRRDTAPSRTSPSPTRIHTMSLTASRDVQKSLTADFVTAKKVPDAHTSAGENCVEFDLQTYIAQTEKEIRKLIKYGQKMRDIAKQQKADNERLKQTLGDVRKDNEVLKKTLARADSTRGADDQPSEMSFEVRRKSVEKGTEYATRDDFNLSSRATTQVAGSVAPPARTIQSPAGSKEGKEKMDRHGQHALTRLASLSLNQSAVHESGPTYQSPPSTSLAKLQPSHNNFGNDEARQSQVSQSYGIQDPVCHLRSSKSTVKEQVEEKERGGETGIEERRRQARERLAARRARISSAPVGLSTRQTGRGSFSDRDRRRSRDGDEEKNMDRNKKRVQTDVDSSCFDPWLGH